MAPWVDESGSTLHEIVQGVKKVADVVVAGIAAASAEQSSGIMQVKQAAMDDVIQHNAALADSADTLPAG